MELHADYNLEQFQERFNEVFGTYYSKKLKLYVNESKKDEISKIMFNIVSIGGLIDNLTQYNEVYDTLRLDRLTPDSKPYKNLKWNQSKRRLFESSVNLTLSKPAIETNEFKTREPFSRYIDLVLEKIILNSR